jgi:hypothetical protein
VYCIIVIGEEEGIDLQLYEEVFFLWCESIAVRDGYIRAVDHRSPVLG